MEELREILNRRYEQTQKRYESLKKRFFDMNSLDKKSSCFERNSIMDLLTLLEVSTKMQEQKEILELFGLFEKE